MSAFPPCTPITENVDAEGLADLVGGLSEAATGWVGFISLILAGWSASAMFAAIRNSLNAAFDVEYNRPYVRAKIVDLALVLGLAPFFLASVVLTGILAFARDGLADTVLFEAIADNAAIWWVAGVITSGALSFVAFFVLLIYGPACHVERKDTWFAALVTCVLFEVAKGGLGFYLARVGDFDPIFGALGGAAIFLIWVNLSARILIFGAELASEYPKVKTGMFDPDPNAPKIPLVERGRTIVRSFFVRDETPPT